MMQVAAQHRRTYDRFSGVTVAAVRVSGGVGDGLGASDGDFGDRCR